MNAVQLYGRYASASIRSQMQFPVAFLMMTGGQFALTFIDIVGVWALFQRFGQIQGWRLGEVAVFYGVIHVSFALADATARGFEMFGPTFVKTGNFDRLLLRPRAPTLQLLGHEVRLHSIGRLTQGLIVLALGVKLTAVMLNVSTAMVLLLSISGGVALFIGIMVLQATLAFWTVESLEIANTLTYGGVEAAQYPLSIYARWFRNFLIFVVPIGCVDYFPIVRLLGRPQPAQMPPWLGAVTPLFGFVFLGLALCLWRIGVRHYTSTGS